MSNLDGSGQRISMCWDTFATLEKFLEFPETFQQAIKDALALIHKVYEFSADGVAKLEWYLFPTGFPCEGVYVEVFFRRHLIHIYDVVPVVHSV